MGTPLHILHVFPTFCPGGAQVRFVRLANAFGSEISYSILAMDGVFDAANLLDPAISVNLISPESKAFPKSVLSIRRLIRQIRPDLVITNNWGSMDAVLASWTAGICPTIHSEDGFGSDEAAHLKSRRVITRRFLLNRIYTTVVPSKTLLRIARDNYHLTRSKVEFIPNGIDTALYPLDLRPQGRRLLGVNEETTMVGFVGHLRPEKTLQVLLEAFAQADLSRSVLALVGDGPQRQTLQDLAGRLGISDRVGFIGHVVDPKPYLRAFDVLAMSSATEQMPLSILEAMACGLPVVTTDVGDCADMLNTREFPAIIPAGNIARFSDALRLLVSQPGLRRALGNANHQRCLSTYSFESMTGAYARLYQKALEHWGKAPVIATPLAEWSTR